MNSKINSISNHGEPDTDMLLENSIYEALRERGWLIPETEEEIVRTLLEMETDPIDFPPELSTPPQIERNRPNEASSIESQKSNRMLSAEPAKPKTVLEFLRERTEKKPSEISSAMGANTIFLSNISRHADVIDINTRQKIANLAEQKFQVPADEVMQCFEYSGHEKMAAFRKTSFDESKPMTYEEIVNSSGMNEEAKRFWLSLAKKGFE